MEREQITILNKKKTIDNRSPILFGPQNRTIIVRFCLINSFHISSWGWQVPEFCPIVPSPIFLEFNTVGVIFYTFNSDPTGILHNKTHIQNITFGD